ncbi:MAG: hypothetical protein RLZ10_1833 [Bacteroidota bacterium]|jgi:Flp pilus assembly protein TadG
MNKHLLSKQKGGVLILFAFLCLFIIGIGGLIIDLSYLYRQKNTLQNEADLAALAGVNLIYRGGTLTNFPNLSPDNTNFWSAYVTNQPSGVIAALNLYENTNTSLSLTSTSQQVGPFNFNGKQVTVYTNGYNNLPTSCRSNSSNVLLSASLPAVCVTISSPYSLFFNALTPTMSATATAITSFPNDLTPAIPLAFADCALATGWDLSTNKPALFNGNPLTLTYNSGSGASNPPTATFSNGAAANCVSTSGNRTIPATWAYMSQLTAGFPTPLPSIAINSNRLYNCVNSDPTKSCTVLNSGVIASLWGNLIDCAATTCKKVAIPIVRSTAGPVGDYTNCSGGATTCGSGGRGFSLGGDTTNSLGLPVIAFACISFTEGSVKKTGSTYNFIAKFDTGCSTTSTSSGSTYYGVLIEPKLAN